ncbi:carotenoid biosynthesis protein [Bacillus sp. 2205SS5-2]|uniref:carotenoid biosynthesis protein n=1 Tax=Bacillus sp. 2205SS5-2 TaxID=3109031 RepID=UPI003003C532
MISIIEWIWGIFLIWYVVGLALVGFNLLPLGLEWANAVFLYLAGTVACIYWLLSFTKRMFIFLFVLFVFGITIFAEFLGVKYGLIFGQYHYEQDFGIQILGVPLTIGFAWVMVIVTSMAFFIPLLQLNKTISRGILYAVGTSLLAVTMDLIIDPVAFIVKEYWIWDEGGVYYNIPTKNFFGWFFVSFFLQSLIYIFVSEKTFNSDSVWERRMRLLYLLVLGMFLLTAVVNGLLVGVTITMISFILAMSFRKWSVHNE